MSVLITSPAQFLCLLDVSLHLLLVRLFSLLLEPLPTCPPQGLELKASELGGVAHCLQLPLQI